MPKPDVAASSPDVSLVRELAEVLNATGLTEIEVERGDLKIRVAKQSAAQSIAYAPAPTAAPASPAATPSVAGSAPELPAGEVVKSPMVGTVYMQSQPGAEPFARKGDTVTKGQTLLLIEAMKTMNPIIAPRDGVVVEILVADAQPVEYGEPLAVIG